MLAGRVGKKSRTREAGFGCREFGKNLNHVPAPARGAGELRTFLARSDRYRSPVHLEGSQVQRDATVRNDVPRRIVRIKPMEETERHRVV